MHAFDPQINPHAWAWTWARTPPGPAIVGPIAAAVAAAVCIAAIIVAAVAAPTVVAAAAAVVVAAITASTAPGVHPISDAKRAPHIATVRSETHAAVRAATAAAV